MAPVTDEHVERVRALVAAIPVGRVATYGDIATAAGLSSPRIVGWIMRADSSELPWHRVITASGRPARHLATRQLELLRAEGVRSVDGKVALRSYRHSDLGGVRRSAPIALLLANYRLGAVRRCRGLASIRGRVGDVIGV